MTTRLHSGPRGFCLLAGAGYAALHLLLWISMAPEVLIRMTVGGDSPGARAEAASVLLGLGLCGAAGVWWPLRAWARGSRGGALRCASLAAVYPASFVPAWLQPPGAPLPDVPWLQVLLEPGTLLLVAAMLFLLPGGGLVGNPAWPAGLYAGSLLLGAALTWAARTTPPPARRGAPPAVVSLGAGVEASRVAPGAPMSTDAGDGVGGRGTSCTVSAPTPCPPR